MPETPTPRVFTADEGTCPTCDADRQTRGPKPPHGASARCESGGRNHCSCDRCF